MQCLPSLPLSDKAHICLFFIQMIYRCCNNEHIVVENGLWNESWARNGWEHLSQFTFTGYHPVDATVRQAEKAVRTHAEKSSISGVQHSICFFVCLVKCQNHHQEEGEVLGTTANICLVCQLTAHQHRMFDLFAFFPLNVLSCIYLSATHREQAWTCCTQMWLCLSGWREW